MATRKQWINSTTVAVDDASGALLVISAPNCMTPMPPETATGDVWDSAGVIELPDGTIKLHVSVDNPAHLLIDTADAAPTANGAQYAAGQTHVLECLGGTRLHYRNAQAGQNVTLMATVLGNK